MELVRLCVQIRRGGDWLPCGPLSQGQTGEAESYLSTGSSFFYWAFKVIRESWALPCAKFAQWMNAQWSTVGQGRHGFGPTALGSLFCPPGGDGILLWNRILFWHFSVQGRRSEKVGVRVLCNPWPLSLTSPRPGRPVLILSAYTPPGQGKGNGIADGSGGERQEKHREWEAWGHDFFYFISRGV